MKNSLAQVRQFLSGQATSECWWSLVEVIEQASVSEQSLLLDYLEQHCRGNPVWQRVRVPCGDWDETSLGWQWSHLEKHSIASLSEGKMVYCPPGTFLMGASDELLDSDGWILPKSKTTLTRGFWILETPVTEGMWENVLPNPQTSFYQHSPFPRAGINWSLAIEFCNALSRLEGLEEAYLRVSDEHQRYYQSLHSLGLPRRAYNRLVENRLTWVGELVQKTEEELLALPGLGSRLLQLLKKHLSKRGLSLETSLDWWPPVACDGWVWKGPDSPGYRLPTEAEWEYAARAGNTRDVLSFPEEIAWFNANSEYMTHPVGEKKPNAWELYDMLGNVQEWCVDSFYTVGGGRGPKVDPVGALLLVERSLRGTSYEASEGFQWMAHRSMFDAFDEDSGVGFRIVRTALD
jgi:formylglycine-generating enzyme required for sulfatase activity